MFPIFYTCNSIQLHNCAARSQVLIPFLVLILFRSNELDTQDRVTNRRQRQMEPLDTGFQVHTPSILHCLIFNVGAADKLSKVNTPLFLVLLLSGWTAK